LPTPDPTRCLAEIVQIAREAGRCILRYCAAPGGGIPLAGACLPCKADASPLTLADLAAHDAIAQRLRARWPQLAVVSEEDAGSHAAAAGAAYWLVDPLDGTKEFLAGTGEFTVNIALVQEGRVRCGVVLAPALDLAYWGGAGLGAERDAGGRVSAIRVEPGERSCPRVVASRRHMNAATERFIAALGPHELVQAGSSLKFCRVAEGSADVYPRLAPTHEWDTAAAQAVVEGAGGQVCTLDGAALRYGKPGLRNPDFVAWAHAPRLSR